jgi:hypothetical protein
MKITSARIVRVLIFKRQPQLTKFYSVSRSMASSLPMWGSDSIHDTEPTVPPADCSKWLALIFLIHSRSMDLTNSALFHSRHILTECGNTPFGDDANDTILLAVVPYDFTISLEERCAALLSEHFCEKGYVVCRDKSKLRQELLKQPDLFAPRLVSRTFDDLVAEKWINFCRINHSSICERARSAILGIKLIDVHSLLVVDSPSQHRMLL